MVGMLFLLLLWIWISIIMKSSLFTIFALFCFCFCSWWHFHEKWWKSVSISTYFVPKRSRRTPQQAWLFIIYMYSFSIFSGVDVTTWHLLVLALHCSFFTRPIQLLKGLTPQKFCLCVCMCLHLYVFIFKIWLENVFWNKSFQMYIAAWLSLIAYRWPCVVERRLKSRAITK